MTMPCFTAEGSLSRSAEGHRGALRGPATAGAAAITPAGTYVQSGDTLYYCYKCMSGSDEPCCNPVGSIAGGTSSGPAVVVYR